MQISNENYLIQQYIEKCKQQNLKVTPQRIAIYKALLRSKNHPTTDIIYQMIRTEFPNISFDTVNRTLLTLAEIGIVDVIESYSGARRFDPNLNSHHHIHCISCGAIIDFENENYDNLNIPEQIEKQYTIVSKRVVFNVICDKCVRKR